MALPPDVKKPTSIADGLVSSIAVNTESVAAAGFFPQNATSTDKAAGVTRDALGNLILTDAIAGSQTLSSLVGGGGGTVTNVSANAPLSVVNGATTPVISLDASGVVADTYGSATAVPVTTVNAQGLVTGVVNTPIAFPITAVTASGVLSASAAPNPDITLSGVVGVTNGGTGSSAVPTNGQLLIGNGVDFSLATLTQGANVSITNAAGSITVAVGVNGLVQPGYIAGEAIAVGDVICIQSDGKVYKANAIVDASATVVAVAATAALAPNDVISGYTFNFASVFAGLTPATNYFLSDTVAGGVSTFSALAPGSRVISLGYAISATTIQLNFQNRGTKP